MENPFKQMSAEEYMALPFANAVVMDFEFIVSIDKLVRTHYDDEDGEIMNLIPEWQDTYLAIDMIGVLRKRYFNERYYNKVVGLNIIAHKYAVLRQRLQGIAFDAGIGDSLRISVKEDSGDSMNYFNNLCQEAERVFIEYGCSYRD